MTRVLMWLKDAFTWVRLSSSDGSKKTDFNEFKTHPVKKNGRVDKERWELVVYGVKVGSVVIVRSTPYLMESITIALLYPTTNMEFS
jgi:hypothetical protein